MSEGMQRFKQRFMKRKVTRQQVEIYLAQKGIPNPLVRAFSNFFAEQAEEFGEEFFGPRTMRSILDGDLMLTEFMLEMVYYESPIQISQYFRQVITEPEMPPLDELLYSVSDWSLEAKHAYVFLTEMALRVVYAIKYEPEYVWRLIRLHEHDKNTVASVG